MERGCTRLRDAPADPTIRRDEFAAKDVRFVLPPFGHENRVADLKDAQLLGIHLVSVPHHAALQARVRCTHHAHATSLGHMLAIRAV